MTWEKFWWGVATYLVIGVVVTLQNSLGKENRAAIKAHNVRWPDYILGIIIGPIGYIIFNLQQRRNK
jgi:hypothetical protein